MRRSCLPVAAVAPLAVALFHASCGGQVISENATSTSAGSGGAAATSSSTGSTGSTGAGGALPGFCGGKAGLPCAPDEWCQFDPASACGNFDATGTCQPRPTVCDADCPGVCGCDGKFYCNACGANAAGMDISNDMTCKAGDSYRAVNLFTNLPRFAIFKASPKRNLCFRLTASLTQTLGIGIYGGMFAVTKAEVTNNPIDCEVPPGPIPPPVGASYPVASGTGTLAIMMVPGGCATGIHAKVLFSGEPPWVPPEEPLDVDNLTIEGGCP